VERDFTIRKKIKGIYNKTIESFPTDLDYRNYEETVEDVIFNLVNNIDVEQTNKLVELYQKDHLQQVTRNATQFLTMSSESSCPSS
jgi:CDK-activating kinase assembly factor MAT1